VHSRPSLASFDSIPARFVSDGEQVAGEHHDMGDHLMVDVAEDFDQTRAVESDISRYTGGVGSEIEELRFGGGEDIVAEPCRC